uniref:SH3 domain containing 19 n=1 Tax=Naja naja TaxID=35670 RepID=A0A8C6X5A7_NAJNA
MLAVVKINCLPFFLKLASRTTYHSEQQRERRRPEITIVAAEPLGPSSWFPGGNRVPQQGLLFQSTHSQTPWRTTELVPAERSIKCQSPQPAIIMLPVLLILDVLLHLQQTDFPEEIISNLPAINVKNNLSVISECKNIPEKSNAAVCPVPKPRSKGNLKPVAKDNQTNNQEQKSPSSSENNELINSLMFLLDNNLKESHIVMDNMDTDNNQSNILSRIKSFEMQGNVETSGLTKKPEVSPRSLGPKPIISAKKPVVAPKPGINRASGEWEQKAASQEKPLQTEEVGSNIITKPELPKKPTLVTVKRSNSNGFLNSGSGSALENTDGQRKVPIPAPRPLLPKKSVSFESPSFPMLPLKPISTVPKPSVAAQSNAFRSPGECFPSSIAPSPIQNITSAEGDLISFDDDVLSFNPAKAVQEISHSESDLTNLPSKAESAKEQPVQPAVVRKPTVIRIPSKSAKALNDILESPPPLPTEKPIGNTSGIAAGKLNNINIINKVIPIQGKIVPSQPSPPKGAPGRPPPPKSTKISSDTDRFPHSSSDVTLHKKPSMLGLGIKKTKSDDFKKHGSDLPPRPKPGHPLYNKYMVRRLISLEGRCDFVHHTDDLELNTGDTVFLLEKIDDEWYRGKCKNRTGIFPASFVKIIVSIFLISNCVKIGPRCRARFEYIGDLKDELSFSEGEVIILKGYINEEWAKGELRGTSGIFPLNFVDVIEDLPESAYTPIFSLFSKLEGQAGQWCDALHDFTAETQEDLSFKKGDCILILEQLDSEWYRGRLNGKEGIFPAVFVHVCSGTVKPKAKALYDFHAENIDELSFKVGDIITSVQSVDEEWMSGELQDKFGIFPRNFVQILHLS